MICHATIGRTHVLLRNPEPGAASRCLVESAECPHCGADLFDSGHVAPPKKHDARAGLTLRCAAKRCGGAWPIRRGDPLEAY